MKTVRALVAVGLVAAFSGMAGATAAQASLSDCNANNMCMWGNNDFKWKIGERGDGSKTVTGLYGDRNDEMDSWANRSASYDGCMYSNANGKGDRMTMWRNSHDDNVAPWNSDQVSSWRTKGGCYG